MKDAPTAGMICLVILGGSTALMHESHHAWVQRQPIEEIKVTAEPRLVPGTIEYRIQQCRHLIWVDGIINGTHIIGKLPAFLDCRDRVREPRKDI